jgi:hypothetical protein
MPSEKEMQGRMLLCLHRSYFSRKMIILAQIKCKYFVDTDHSLTLFAVASVSNGADVPRFIHPSNDFVAFGCAF